MGLKEIEFNLWNSLASITRLFCHDPLARSVFSDGSNRKKGKPTCCPFLRYSRTRILPAVTSAASVSPITSTTVTPFHRPGLVNCKGAPVEVSAVKGLDGPLGLSPGTHVHEPETP